MKLYKTDTLIGGSTYVVDNAVGSLTALLAAVLPANGWTLAQDNGAGDKAWANGFGRVLRVYDDGATARIKGYTSSAHLGAHDSNVFPTEMQAPQGVYLSKPAATDWYLLCNTYSAYFVADTEWIGFGWIQQLTDTSAIDAHFIAGKATDSEDQYRYLFANYNSSTKGHYAHLHFTSGLMTLTRPVGKSVTHNASLDSLSRSHGEESSSSLFSTTAVLEFKPLTIHDAQAKAIIGVIPYTHLVATQNVPDVDSLVGTIYVKAGRVHYLLEVNQRILAFEID